MFSFALTLVKMPSRVVVVVVLDVVLDGAEADVRGGNGTPN